MSENKIELNAQFKENIETAIKEAYEADPNNGWLCEDMMERIEEIVIEEYEYQKSQAE